MLRSARRQKADREPCCFSQYVRYAVRLILTIVNNIYCIPAYVVWMMVLRVFRPLIGSLYWKIEGYLFHWLLAMVSMWSWSAGYEIVESGDDPAACSGQRTLVIANHQSTGDVPMLMSAWNPRPGVLPNLMWIMDRVFKFTNFGIVSITHQDFFIQGGRDSRVASLDALRQHINNVYLPLHREFLVLFPEGGFLHKRKEISARFAEKNNLPQLEYVTLPRAGAMRVIMEEVGPRAPGPSASRDKKSDDDNQNDIDSLIQRKDHLEWILDLTIAYPDRVPIHLQDIVCGIRPPCTTRLHYRLYPSKDVPEDEAGMTKWLYDRFLEKDKMLEEFYRTGEFPGKGSNHTRIVRQDFLRYLVLHLFFITSTCIQVKLFYVMLSLSFGW